MLVIVLEKIPERLETNYLYILQIFIPIQWHTELITMYNVKQFCFDDTELVISNVTIDQNKINIIIEK